MSLQFDGYLMSRDLPVAQFSQGKCNPLREELLPFHFANHGTLEEWLQRRAMDCHSRTNARLLRRALRIEDNGAEWLSFRVEGATITDTYWLKAEGSSLTYQDICFQENAYWEFALNGPSVNDFSGPVSRTPELTNTGSFEKCWKKEPDGWWLYKHGKPENIFSELMAYSLGKRLGFCMAHYEFVDEQTIRTRDFTAGATVNFETARGLGLRSDQHIDNYQRLAQISPGLAMEYAQMVTLDALIYNADRHADNFGILRDVNTGSILSLAPNYDNNLSLLALGIPNRESGSDFLRDWQNLILFYRVPLSLPPLAPGEIAALAEVIPCKVDKQTAVDFLQYRYQWMQQSLDRARQLWNPLIEP
ncbi:hypothetical protein [Fournierella sp.]|uniref:hypothetical protein n=1 Tax=Allofournierella sp. TaxID=1940256 RepID=UPI00307AA755